MRHIRILAFVARTSAVSFALPCLAQADLSVSTAALNSPNWEIRQQEFDKLQQKLYAIYKRSPLPGHVDMPQATQDAVIDLLLREAHQDETKRVPAVAEGSEAAFDFFADIVELVIRIGTAKAAYALLDPEVIISGAAATGAVARAGHLAVAPVVQRFDTLHPVAGDDTDEDVYALSLLMVMNALLSDKAPPLETGDRTAIEKRLLAASESPSVALRRASTRGLALLSDDAAKARLEAMAETDPAKVVTANQGVIFPVRQEASDALANWPQQ